MAVSAKREKLPNQTFASPCSSGVEHFLGKEEVAGSNPAIGSTIKVCAEKQ